MFKVETDRLLDTEETEGSWGSLEKLELRQWVSHDLAAQVAGQGTNWPTQRTTYNTNAALTSTTATWDELMVLNWLPKLKYSTLRCNGDIMTYGGGGG